MWQFIWQLAGLLVGGLITLVVSWYFYKRAGDELRAEADKIRRLNDFICTGLEQAGLAKFRRNKDGEISAMYIELKTAGPFKIHGTATLTADKKAEDSETPRNAG